MNKYFWITLFFSLFAFNLHAADLQPTPTDAAMLVGQVRGMEDLLPELAIIYTTNQIADPERKKALGSTLCAKTLSYSKYISIIAEHPDVYKKLGYTVNTDISLIYKSLLASKVYLDCEAKEYVNVVRDKMVELSKSKDQ